MPKTDDELMQEHISMMKDPESWFNIALPVVRRGNQHPSAAIVNAIAALDGRCELIVGNIWDNKLDWTKAEHIQFESFEACYRDGWRVD